MTPRPPIAPVRRARRGFTLIELVVLIVVLGVLAAFAIPRFIDLSTQARETAMRGLADGLRGAAELAHGLALAQGQAGPTGSVVVEGRSVALAFGYPTADEAGIAAAMPGLEGFTLATPSRSTMTFTPVDAPANAATCQVTYVQATTPAVAAAVRLPVAIDCS